MVLVFAALFVAMPQAKAAYDCAANVLEANLSTCCYPEGSEPYQGVFCRADGLFLQKIGSYPPVCKTPPEIMTLATTATAKNYVGFNCFTNSLNTACKDSSYCPQPNGCILWAANAACTAANKDTICGTTCGNCSTGYFQCGNTCVNDIPVDAACTAKGRVTTCSGCGGCSDSSKLLCGDTCVTPFATDATAACRYGIDACTGACQSCPSGKTPSGTKSSRECITYAERFLEIISYGLAKYGKFGTPAENGRYDYSVTGVEPLMSDVYLKSDIAENLNWNNTTTLPPVIQSLISNNGNNSYFTCDVKADCPVGSMECSEAGLCYTPGGTAGVVCSSASACNLGLMCDASGHCADPNGELTACTNVGAACAVAGQTCGTDHYCHVTTAAIGDVCANNTQCPAGALCNYATPRVCEAVAAAGSSTLSFVGITSAKYTAGFTVAPKGYQGANNVCSSDAAVGFSNSHVCTSGEILTLYNQKNTKILAETGNGIVTAGPPGYTANADDCRGFMVKTLAGEKVYFRWWNFTSKYGSMSECANNLLGFACCK